MFKGQVDFLARVLDTGRTFTAVHFKPPVAGVESAKVEMTSIEELSGTVRISSVATVADGMDLARAVIESTFNRLAFFHGMAIEPARVTGSQFTSASQATGNHAIPSTCHIQITGHAPRVIIGVSSATIQGELESFEPPGEVNFSHFRSARLSVGPVEEFMHLYAVLLSLFNDSQKKVDDFVVSVEPGVQQTQIPQNVAGKIKMETIYTRLRNELAHKRQGVSLQATKLEMSKSIAPLHTIVRQAIAQHS